MSSRTYSIEAGSNVRFGARTISAIVVSCLLAMAKTCKLRAASEVMFEASGEKKDLRPG
jgi:hypothetical protein